MPLPYPSASGSSLAAQRVCGQPLGRAAPDEVRSPADLAINL